MPDRSRAPGSASRLPNNMCKLTTAVSKSSTRHRAAALACAFACLTLTGCGTPLQPEGSVGPTGSPRQILADAAGYASWLARQPDSLLERERERLQAEPESPDRNLRLALLHGVRSSAVYDPQIASRLLIRIATDEPEGSVHGQLAQILFTGQPDPKACQETARLNALSTGLANQLTEVQAQSQNLETQLEVARKELETERAERARLESQLKALKSLEAQIKGRDEPG